MSEKYFHYTIEPLECLIFTPSENGGLQNIFQYIHIIFESSMLFYINIFKYGDVMFIVHMHFHGASI